jgi:hypothetical protein
MSVEEKVANGREVVADVGRLAARWILWSRKRLGLTLLAVLLVGLAIGQLTGPAHPGKASRPSAATTGPSTGIGAGQNQAPRTDVPTPYIAPPENHAVDEATAVKFVQAYLAPAGPSWLPTLQALLAPSVRPGFSADRATVQGTLVTGDATWSQTGIDVPTDAGAVTVTIDPASGLVADIQPAASGNVAAVG